MKSQTPSRPSMNSTACIAGTSVRRSVERCFDLKCRLTGLFAILAVASAGHPLLADAPRTYSWGANANGQLGNGTTTQATTPAVVTATGVLSGKTVTAVALGRSHTLALADGAVYAWGLNTSGQLGDNSTTQRTDPVAVSTSGALSGKTVIAIAAGGSHSLALCSDGTLVAWGSNQEGQVGNNSTTQSPVPVAINSFGALSGKTVTAIGAGRWHSVALCSDGKLVAWGANTYGELGDGGLTPDSLIPVAVSVAAGDSALDGKIVTAIAVGAAHNLALCSDGTLAVWGRNDSGQLGLGVGDTTQRNVPKAVTFTGPLALKTLASISAGGSHSLVRFSDGTAVAWGDNSSGQIGDRNSRTYVADTGNHTIRRVSASGLVTTLAGTAGSSGSTDGTGSAARFYNPSGLALDSSGNLYVGDTDNHTIRKVTPTGTVTIFAGSVGSAGNTNGAALSAAKFRKPNGLAVDLNGVVYVADTDNHLIRKISAGVVSTLAGAGTSGTTDGTGTGARFNSPRGVAVDSTGTNLYVADTGNHSIRQIVISTGVVTTLAGSSGPLNSGSTDGIGSAARFYNPRGIAIDPTATNLYVADATNNTVRKIEISSRTVSTFAGTAGTGNSGSDDNTGTAARFFFPTSVAVDAEGNVYVEDSNNYTTRKITSAAAVTTLAGTAGSRGSTDGAGGSAWFYNPQGIAVDLGALDSFTSVPVTVNAATGVSALAGKNVAAVSAGASHSLALCSDDTLATWGDNTYGQIGDGSGLQRIVPVSIAPPVAGTDRYTALGVGSTAIHSVALVIGTPEIAVEQPAGTNLVDGSSTAIDFGSRGVSLTVTKTFTIKNLGTGDLTGLSASVTGGDSGDYLPSSPVALLSPGASTTFTVTFTPSAAGTRNTTLRIASNDSDENPFDILLTGLGVDYDAAFTSATSNIAPQNGFTATGKKLALTLDYAPTPGTTLTVIQNTALSFISGVFDNLAQGEERVLQYDGKSYRFIANYFGGNGNDLVLVWKGARAFSWGSNLNAQLGDSFTTQRNAPVSVFWRSIVSAAAGTSHSLAICSDASNNISLLAWGLNTNGQLGNGTTSQSLIPLAVATSGALSGKTPVAVAAGSAHSLVLCSDGTVAAWGYNNAGQLGDGTTTQRTVPVDVTSNGALYQKRVVAIAAGASHSMALCSDGTVATWGLNTNGQLGNSLTTNSSLPLAVNTKPSISALSGKTVTAISAGTSHSLALCSDGTVVSWGLNGSGQLGDNTTAQRLVPVAVNTASGVSQLYGKTVAAISAGASHSLALCSDGTVVAWGLNGNGQLGDSSITQRNAPVNVVSSGVLSGKTVTSIRGGGSHSLARCSDGTLAAWGNNLNGQLGDSTVTQRTAPVAVNSAAGSALYQKGATEVVAGASHSLALCTDGTLAVWGLNTNGQLGDGSTTQRTIPVTAGTSGVLTGKTVLASAVGANHSLALCSDGTVATWGLNANGQLGDNSSTQRIVPVDVKTSGVLNGKTVVALAAGDTHSLALCVDGAGTGSVAAWGLNTNGQLGDNSTTQRILPVTVTGLSAKKVIAIASGAAHNLALCDDGTLWAWGANTYGQLGDNSTTQRNAPVNLTAFTGNTVVAIAAGGSHSLAVCSDGSVYAWGLNTNGQLGDNSTTQRNAPVAITTNGALAGRTVSSITAGLSHSLALCSDGSLVAWGANIYGQLGDRSLQQRTLPVLVDTALYPSVSGSGVLVGKTILAIGAGHSHSLALCSDGNLASWGRNLYGQLGDNSTTQRTVPVTVNRGAAGSTSLFVGISKGAMALHNVAFLAGPPEIVVEYPIGTSFAEGSSTSFPTTSVGSAGLSKTFVIRNTGATDLSGLSLSKSPFSDTDFLVSRLGVSTLAPGAMTTISVSFVPSASGSRAAALQIANNDGDESPFDISLTGTGTTNVAASLVIANTPAISQETFTATGKTLAFDLKYAPTPGMTVPVIEVTGPAFITGKFTDPTRRLGVLSQGDDVFLQFGGTTYHFVANYFGGNGNDFVLSWKNARAFDWGYNSNGQLGEGLGANPRTVPYPVNAIGVLTGKTVAAVAGGGGHSLILCSDGTVLAAGNNANGQLGDNSLTQRNLPVLVNTTSGTSALFGKTVKTVAAGVSFSLAMTTDTTNNLFAWGLNSSGQLGLNDTTQRQVPVGPVAGSLSGKTVVSIAAGNAHSLALCSDGTLHAWGLNTNGQLGNNSTTQSNLPIAIGAFGALSGKTVVAIAAGTSHSLALCSDGTLASWGLNTTGQLGNNSTTQSLIPVAINSFGALFSRTVTAIAAGNAHSLALCSDGMLAAWGDNTYGQIGDNSNTQRNIPVEVNRTSGVSALFGKTALVISAGANHSLALCSDGILVAWGNNPNGQLGDGSTSQRLAPVTTAGVLGGKTPIGVSAGSDHNLAVCSDGALVSWGYNSTGQLGLNDTSNRTLPVQVNTAAITTNVSPLTGKTVVAAAAGGFHSFALCSDGTLAAWGLNGNGQLGDNSTSQRNSPVDVTTRGALSGKTIVAVSAGYFHSLALCSDGTLAAWGLNENGQLGNNTTTQSPLPVAINAFGTLAGKSVVAIAAGGYHSMALCSDGTVHAWGGNAHGELGIGTIISSQIPVAVSVSNAPYAYSALASKTVVEISAGNYHSLALCSDGTVAAWGLNTNGQLGDGTSVQRNLPVLVVGVITGKTVKKIAAGGSHNLALYDNTVAAWGLNGNGQIGNNGTTTQFSSISINTGLTVVDIGAGYAHSQALSVDGTLVAWGRNDLGQVGDNSTTQRNAPVAVNRTNLLSTEIFCSVFSGSMAHHTLGLVAAPLPEITVEGPVGTELVDGSSSVPFVFSTTPVTQTIKISNVGTGAMTGVLVAQDGTHMTDFAISTWANVAKRPGENPFADVNTIAAGSNTSVNVTFRPLASGTRTASLHVDSNDTDEMPFDATLSGSSNTSVVATFTSATDIPVTSEGYTASDKTITFDLQFAPALPSSTLTVVRNTGPAFISGQFRYLGQTLTQGQTLSLVYGGISYNFVVNYFGGTGNDLVLIWKGARTYAWGLDSNGQVGNNSTTTPVTTPVAVNNQNGGSNPYSALYGKTVIATATGSAHTLALCSDGTVASWGVNTYGQLGDNSTSQRQVPVFVNISAAISGKTVVAIAAGANHSLALCSDGTVAAWGLNDKGQLGNNTTNNSSVPIAVTRLTGTGKTFVAIAAGASHSLALCADGTVAAWGDNTNGQIGDGSTTQSLVPILVDTSSSSALSGRVVLAIAAGANHNLALCSDGLLAGWGLNSNGQVGDNSTTTRLRPVALNSFGVLSTRTIAALAAGAAHSLVLCTDNSMAAWGLNSDSQLGDGSTTQRNVPVTVSTGAIGIKTITGIVAGGNHNLALAPDATTQLYAWGDNAYAQLGDGSTTDRAAPVAVSRGSLNATDFFTAIPTSLYGNHSLALVTGAPEIDVRLVISRADNRSVTGTALTTGSSTVAFGSAPLGSATEKLFTIWNTGGGSADLTGLAITVDAAGLSGSGEPAAPADYVVSGLNTTTLPPGTSVTFSVNFTPLAEGSRYAMLHIASNDSNENPFNIKLSGSGTRNFSADLTSTSTLYSPPLTVTGIDPDGDNVAFNLQFAPSQGSILPIIRNTGPASIGGLFTYTDQAQSGVAAQTLTQGQEVRLLYNGTYYTLVANYYGGDGNDLVLVSKGMRVSGWGSNAYGQVGDSTVTDRYHPVPVTSTRKAFVATAAGDSHTVALYSDGTLAAWGLNTNGQLGDGTTSQSLSPVPVMVSFALAGRTVTAVAVGASHSLALCSDGTIAAWGANSKGQLGNNSTTQSNTPVSVNTTSGVSALFGKTVLAIAAGANHSLALCSDGTLVAWGDNTNGQLGNGSTTQSNVPVLVTRSGALSSKTVAAVAAGASHSLIFCNDGTAFTWGLNTSGQLGDGTNTQSTTPVAVDTSASSAIFGKAITGIAAGGNHCLVRCGDGSLAAWGSNSNGQLGDNTTTDSNLPVTVNAVSGVSAIFGKTVVALVAGTSHSVALCDDGTIAAWGNNAQGRLGIGNTTQWATPVAVDVGASSALYTKSASTVSAGGSHTLATCSDGTLAAWGANPNGQLGDGSNTDRLFPTSVSASGVLSGKTVIAVANGRRHSLALCSNGSIAAWGDNSLGQLGDATQTQRNAPVLVVPGALAGKTVVNIAAGAYHSMALCSDGTVAVWGSNSNGQLGLAADLVAHPVPLAVSGGALNGKTVTAIASGDSHCLALCSDGTVVAWGRNDTGQLGNNSVLQNNVPVAVVTTGVLANEAVVAIAAGGTHNLALCFDGTLVAWGSNSYGQIGDNSTTQRNSPVATYTASTSSVSTALEGRIVVAIAAGAYHSLALSADVNGSLAVSSWGNNTVGQLGDNSVSQRNVPVSVSASYALAGKVPLAIAAGDSHSLTLCSDGTIAAWGVSMFGQIGDNTTSTRLTPVLVNSTWLGSTVRFGALPVGPTSLHSLGMIGGPPTVLEQPAGTVLVDGALADFGSTVVGTSATAKIFTLRNTGSSDLTGLSIVKSGLNLGDFDLFVPAQTSLVPGASLTFSAAFHPNSSGQKFTSLKITSNDYLIPFTVWMAGVGTSELTATFAAASDVPLTNDGFSASGKSLSLALQFAPPPGTSLMVVNNTGRGFISGQFSNLAHGQVLSLSYGGTSYPFVANYFGGDGNDLMLVWKGTRPFACGVNANGQLGDNGSANRFFPFPVNAASSDQLFGKTVFSIATGSAHSLALCSDHVILAWGDNTSGQLGNNSTLSSPVPVPVISSGVLANKSVAAVAAGATHSLALCSDGTLVAWGDNSVGQLGDGTTTQHSQPVIVPKPLGRTYVAVAAGASHSLAICDNGAVYAWGLNTSGQLGNGSTTDSPSPVLIGGLLTGKTAIAVVGGTSHSLALCKDGTLAAWGLNTSGQVGDDTTSQRLSPVAVSRSAGRSALFGRTVVAIAAGSAHCLALCSDHTVAAWGDNTNGQLGNNGTTSTGVPTQLTTTGSALVGRSVSAIAAGASSSMALCADGTLAAWGLNTEGQLGDNTTTQRLVPTAVNRAAVSTVLNSREAFTGVASGPSSNHTLALVAGLITPELVIEDPVIAGSALISQSSTVHFGTVAVGGSKELTFVVRNSGVSDLTGWTITPTGTNATDFTVTATPTPTTPLATSGNSSFKVMYSPGAAGFRTAVLRVVSNDSDENPFEISLTGSDSDKPQMISPAAGSTLSLSTAVFKWSPGTGITGFALQAGSTRGGSDYYNSGILAGTIQEQNVRGLPTDGSTVYVRLRYQLGGVWYSTDYTYKATNNPSLPKDPEMVTPSPGSTLTTSSANFTWSTGNGVSAFWLFVGSSQGAKNYHDSLLLANTVDTRTVTGLPTDGSAIYVRLWYMVSGIWYSKDYTYTAFTVPGSSLPDISSPVNGATLTGATQTFTWIANSSATAYWLQAGSSQGTHNYFDSGSLSSNVLSQTVGGLPVNGTTVYVRLSALLGGNWSHKYYTYTAFTGTKAEMATPANGTSLTAGTVTFTWNAGTSATAYYLQVGDKLGAYNYSDSGQLAGSVLSRTVAGLPTNGSPIYVRLWSLIGGTWASNYNDYTYTAFSGPGSNKAELISPSSASALPAAPTSVTFEWNPAVGASGYWLYVGSSPGASDYYKSPSLANSVTSQTVSNVRSPTPSGLGKAADGSIVFVRLWTKQGTAWLYNDYSFRANSP